MAFTAELQATAARLATEPIDGACGDGCACFSDEAVANEAVAVQLGRSVVDETVPIACSLNGADIAQRLTDWEDVIGQVVHRDPAEGGVRLVFGVDAPLGEIARLAAAEYECCPFFAFALTVDTRGIALEVTAPPAGAEILAATFGTPA